MSLRLGALHDALLDPGNADKAQRAAEELANYDSQLADLKSDMKLVKWMLGTNVAVTLSLLWLILRMYETLAQIAAKVGVP